jgi:hypothetical protein
MQAQPRILHELMGIVLTPRATFIPLRLRFDRSLSIPDRKKPLSKLIWRRSLEHFCAHIKVAQIDEKLAIGRQHSVSLCEPAPQLFSRYVEKDAPGFGAKFLCSRTDLISLSSGPETRLENYIDTSAQQSLGDVPL